ncbi:MAG TPA: hypothetical protein VFX16_25075 [Pseudonocardiaceae bacterium]|nr:hypothetical protein [Pseudonocardiaceae bacterium]
MAPSIRENAPYGREATAMQGVHTILVTPQWYVNSLLTDLLDDDTNGLRKVKVSLKPGGPMFLTGSVAELSVRVLVPGSVGKVAFAVRFESGTMDYRDLTSDSSAVLKADISGLRMSFLVDLAKAGVSDLAAVPAVVRDRADALAKSFQGAFTIQQLFLDLANANLAAYDPAGTTFPEKMSSSAIAMFPIYLAAYLEEVRKAGGHVLGYAVTVPDWTDPTPSFPPHSIDFVTNEYRDGTDKADNRAMDSIQYLMMTGTAKLPANLAAWWGDFIQPTDGFGNSRYGAVAMARKLFVDDYLLPRLAPLVCGYWKLADTSGGLDVARSAVTSGDFVSTPDGGSFSYGPVSSKSHQTNTFSNDDMEYTFAWNVTLKYVPGTATVRIERTVDFHIRYTHWYGIDGHAASASFGVEYHVPMAIVLTILGAVDGTLQVSAVTELPTEDPGTLSDLPHPSCIVGTEGDGAMLAPVLDTFDSAVDAAVDAALAEALPDRIATTLAHQLNVTPFVFPGGAQLSMIDPVFNDHGDLLMGTSAKS